MAVFCFSRGAESDPGADADSSGEGGIKEGLVLVGGGDDGPPAGGEEPDRGYEDRAAPRSGPFLLEGIAA